MERYQYNKTIYEIKLSSMSSALCTFQGEFEFSGDDTLGIGRPFDKLVMMKSNPPNLQMRNETQVF